MHIAAKKGNLDIVNKIIESKNANLNSVDELGESALHFAVKSGNKEIVEKLIDAGANVDLVSKDSKWTPMNYAVQAENLDMVKYLATKIKDINSQDDFGRTYLGMSVHNQSKDIIDVLIKSGADATIIDGKGETAFHEAALSNDSETITKIIATGGNYREKNKRGQTPLLIAAQNSESNGTETMDLLLSMEGVDLNDLNAVDEKGRTKLMQAISDGKDDIAVALIKKGANVNAQSKKGMTALHDAIKIGNEKMLELLLENGANPNLHRKKGSSPLQRATSKGGDNYKMVEMLLEKGADPEFQDKEGFNALHYAVTRAGDSTALIKLLNEHGANQDTPNNAGDLPLHYAASAGKHEEVKLMLKYGVNVNAQGSGNNTAAHIAADCNHGKVVEELLKAKNINLKIKNSLNHDVFDVARVTGNQDITKMLKLDESRKWRDSVEKTDSSDRPKKKLRIKIKHIDRARNAVDSLDDAQDLNGEEGQENPKKRSISRVG